MTLRLGLCLAEVGASWRSGVAGSVQVVPGLLYMLDVQLVTGSVLLLWRLPWYCFTDWLWQKAWPPVRGSLGLPNTLCTSAEAKLQLKERERGAA